MKVSNSSITTRPLLDGEGEYRVLLLYNSTLSTTLSVPCPVGSSCLFQIHGPHTVLSEGSLQFRRRLGTSYQPLKRVSLDLDIVFYVQSLGRRDPSQSGTPTEGRPHSCQFLICC